MPPSDTVSTKLIKIIIITGADISPTPLTNGTVRIEDPTGIVVDGSLVTEPLAAHGQQDGDRPPDVTLKLSHENELIGDWLVALTNAKKTWGFGLCFLHLRNVKGVK